MDRTTSSYVAAGAIIGGAFVGYLLDRVANTAWRSGHSIGYRAGKLCATVEAAQRVREAAESVEAAA